MLISDFFCLNTYSNVELISIVEVLSGGKLGSYSMVSFLFLSTTGGLLAAIGCLPRCPKVRFVSIMAPLTTDLTTVNFRIFFYLYTSR